MMIIGAMTVTPLTVTVIDFILARTVVTHEMMMIVVVALIVVGEEVN